MKIKRVEHSKARDAVVETVATAPVANGPRIKHPSFQYADGVIRLADPLRAEGDFREVDIRKLLLPATSISPAKSIAEHPKLLRFLLAAVARFCEQRRASKTSAESIAKIIRVVSKVIEYLFLEGVYDPSVCTRRTLERLLNEYSQGGWERALRLEERTKALATKLGKRRLRQIVRINRDGRLVITQGFVALLSTNCAGVELEAVRRALSTVLPFELKGATPSAARDSVACTALFQVLDTVNQLAHLPNRLGFPFVPFPSPFELADQHGRPGGRTRNIKPTELGALLAECFAWIFDISSPLLKFLHELAIALKRIQPNSASHRTKLLASLAAESIHAAEFAELSGWTIRRIRHEKGLKADECTLSNAVDSLMTACFLIIVCFNARRKDEVQHPKIGLAVGSLRKFGTTGNLHVCEFYLEKYTKDFKDFFVNDATVAAITVLQQLQEIESTLTGKARSSARQSLFRVVTMRARSPLNYRQYSFIPQRSAKKLLKRAFQGNMDISFAAHMGRRAYCLIMMYRYSNPAILALSQQMGHTDLDSIMVYLTDPRRGNTIAELEGFGRFRHPPDGFPREVSLEMANVSRERLVEIVEGVIADSTSPQSGFAKFVTRLHARLGSTLKYDDKSMRSPAAVVADLLIGRGHKVTPLRHADCCAPDLRSPSAKCSNGAGVVRRENASPKTCRGCRYQSQSPSHALAMREGAEHLRRLASELPVSSLERAKLLTDAEELIVVSSLYSQTLY